MKKRRPASCLTSPHLSTTSPYRVAKKKREQVIGAWRHGDAIAGAPYGLDCAQCPRDYRCDEWGVPGTGYAFEGQDLLRRQWDQCPAALLRDPHLVTAVRLYRALQLSPLAGWPDAYPAWVEDYLQAIDEEVKKQEVN